LMEAFAVPVPCKVYANIQVQHKAVARAIRGV
jgi:hypothetical protein